ncbi:MAG: hypothetical protein N3E49_04935 [Bacteroidia bacterium]|nr:hypothetical protein [Bacteroidia bacterium]
MNTLRDLEELLVPVSDTDLPGLLQGLQAKLCVELGVVASILYTDDPLDADLYRFEVGSGLAREPTPSQFRIGEGFLGQVVKERRLLGERFPGEALGSPATSAIVEAPEVTLLAIPLIYQDHVEGVWCIAAEKDLTPLFKQDEWQDFLYKWAAYLQSIRSRRYIQSLLERSQVQNQELITREEELRQNLEELAVTQEEMHRAQLLLAKQSERQNFIIDLFTLMATANPDSFRSLARILLAQSIQYFRAEAGGAFLREETTWRLLSTWTRKKSHLSLPPKWDPPFFLTEALEKLRQAVCYPDVDVGFESNGSYWLLLPYYTTAGLTGLICMAFPEPYPIEAEGTRDLLHIPIAYFSAYERIRKEEEATVRALDTIARVSEAQVSIESIDTPVEELPWLTEVPLVQRQAYIAALREALTQQRVLWTPPEDIACREIVVFTNKVFYRMKWR